MSRDQQAPALDDVEAGQADEGALRRGDASGDSPKRQGDKLRAGTSAAAEASATGIAGDSAKPHGDKLERAVKEAAAG